jgi:hypothetical protein
MLTSPIVITVDTVNTDCHKITEEKSSSLYSSTDGNLSLKVSHQESKNRTRHMARIDSKVLAEDPLTAVNQYQSAGVYIVIDEPLYGFTDAEIENQVTALKDFLTSANIAAMLANRH